MVMKPITTEKAVRLIELENTLVIKVERRLSKDKIKKEFEETFNVKVSKIRTMMKKNEKYAYIKLDKKNPAIDVATKLGMI
jgi:large subunit ribosomal protein L23